jgi:hypothetical protein
VNLQKKQGLMGAKPERSHHSHSLQRLVDDSFKKLNDHVENINNWESLKSNYAWFVRSITGID